MRGRLTGAELDIEGVGDRAGDRIVTVAPTTNGEIVTSQRGVVTSVEVDTRSLTAIMDDGRGHHLGADDIAPDRLAHGYATTVHRSQGATVDTAHVFADGGGREFGYVAMSRARQASHVHVVADNPNQAAEDLARDLVDRATPKLGDRHRAAIEDVFESTGDTCYTWHGLDERGRELEIIALDRPDCILVVHVMPNYRGRKS